MNKVKTIDKVNLSMMIKSQEELIPVVGNINAFFCDTSFYYLFKDNRPLLKSRPVVTKSMQITSCHKLVGWQNMILKVCIRVKLILPACI